MTDYRKKLDEQTEQNKRRVALVRGCLRARKALLEEFARIAGEEGLDKQAFVDDLRYEEA